MGVEMVPKGIESDDVGIGRTGVNEVENAEWAELNGVPVIWDLPWGLVWVVNTTTGLALSEPTTSSSGPIVFFKMSEVLAILVRGWAFLEGSSPLDSDFHFLVRE